MKRLFFIRHGESQDNSAQRFSGRHDCLLTDFGRQQAKLAGRKAKTLDIDQIISSPLKRARETAEIIAKEIGYPVDKIILSDLLMERDYGNLQGEPYTAAEGLDLETVNGMELTPDLIKRAAEAYRFLQSLPADNILVSSHGTLGRTLRLQIYDQGAEPVEVPITEEIPNAQIVEWQLS